MEKRCDLHTKDEREREGESNYANCNMYAHVEKHHNDEEGEKI